MKLSERLEREHKHVEKTLGEKVICQRCQCTLATYFKCTAGLSEICEGFNAIEAARAEFAEQEKGCAGK